MTGVEIRGLRKSYGDVAAVDKIDLTVNRKDFFVLLGPSGCGKTTTLRCIAGLEKPDEGDIYIEDDCVNEVEPKDRNIAMVFQNYALYPHMTVLENIEFPLKMRKIPKNERREEAKKAAQLLKISHLLDRKPRQLSGGERQRTALGRAIVRKPRLFLMDEPLSNLDAKLRIYMRVELKKLQNNLGVTTIYVTHDQVEAMVLCDKMAIMDLGKIQQIGTTEEVFRYPANKFVGGFIGSPPMNFIDCSWMMKDEIGYLDAGEFTMALSGKQIEKLRTMKIGSELVLGIRPEDITVLKKRTPECQAQAEVYLTEPLGKNVIVNFMIGENLIKANIPYEFDLKIGETVHIAFDKTNVCIFSKKTEKLIF